MFDIPSEHIDAIRIRNIREVRLIHVASLESDPDNISQEYIYIDISNVKLVVNDITVNILDNINTDISLTVSDQLGVYTSDTLLTYTIVENSNYMKTNINDNQSLTLSKISDNITGRNETLKYKVEVNGNVDISNIGMVNIIYKYSPKTEDRTIYIDETNRLLNQDRVEVSFNILYNDYDEYNLSNLSFIITDISNQDSNSTIRVETTNILEDNLED